ncbi:response regulator [Candidatus Woesearchaeota archaeon CG10_big_fil_rev_8_21_14_0_10_45_16]|nr:MAG: response regulator [Candidatus Woesearchaeota archaeon CG10_big_fil_rev_8_21_14_0_10_45_16]
MTTVLVVEDRSDTRNMVVEALRKSGYAVLEAEDGEKALEIVGSKNVDCILLDILLPKKDGGQVLTAVRANKKNDHIKIVMITAAKATPATIRLYKKNGANGFLLKPLQVKEIRDEIGRVLKMTKKKSAHSL